MVSKNTRSTVSRCSPAAVENNTQALLSRIDEKRLAL
jgi:hypothetical protein